ncbi:MAG TPA: hypothetical protein VEI01_21935 [Terriglobales bacterium]|nr:hypothetical protein [Terriglobales bacterium]
MTSRVQNLGNLLVAVLMTAGLAVSTASAAGKTQSFVGQVGDSMCGAHHMGGTPAECTRICVSKGAKYSLVVGDKVYTLDTTDKNELDRLSTLAGEKAKVTGTVDGDIIKVASVEASK